MLGDILLEFLDCEAKGDAARGRGGKALPRHSDQLHLRPRSRLAQGADVLVHFEIPPNAVLVSLCALVAGTVAAIVLVGVVILRYSFGRTGTRAAATTPSGPAASKLMSSTYTVIYVSCSMEDANSRNSMSNIRSSTVAMTAPAVMPHVACTTLEKHVPTRTARDIE